MSALILGLSSILQFTAALLSVRLIQETGKWKAWSFIAAAMTLMGVRRSITLYRTLSGDRAFSADLTAEFVALSISILMVLGVYLIGPIFKKINTTNTALQKSEERFRIVSDLSYDILWEWNIAAGVLTWFGDIDKQLGYQKGGFPRTIDAWESIIHPEDCERVTRNLEKHHKEHIPWHEGYRIIKKDGEVRYWDDRGETRWDEDGTPLIMTGAIIDVTERKEAENKLSYQATHDTLTGLVNRREFERRAERLLSSFDYNEEEHALCYLDLDQFKVVNDSCGHTAGDEMLRQLSFVLKQIVRQRDTLARLGGDEFGILMEHCSLDDAHRVTTSIQKSIQDFQFTWEGHSFKVGVSIGLVPIKENLNDLTDLLSFADAACYTAKENGRNRIHVYHPDDADIAMRHGEMQWVERINQALEDDLFCLYSQEIVSFDSGTDKHYEILIRMLDERGEIIPPGAFLPAAERYNLISKVDRWVIEKVFNLLIERPQFFNKINFISINISGQSLAEEDFQVFVIKKMMDSLVKPEKVCFEITETAAISNLNVANQFISKMKVLGCQFALDDFGSGLSSFAYLKNLPVNYLKIDGMFVRDVADDPIDHAMVKSINEIGHVMGMQTIAEFVENDEIKEIMREIGVDYIQGYGIGKPQPIEELLEGDLNNITNIRDANKKT
jgi:diguanylate cyclase (GGDEF)-like protein/PAS domain S-box-containing protein